MGWKKTQAGANQVTEIGFCKQGLNWPATQAEQKSLHSVLWSMFYFNSMSRTCMQGTQSTTMAEGCRKVLCMNGQHFIMRQKWKAADGCFFPHKAISIFQTFAGNLMDRAI